LLSETKRHQIDTAQQQ